MKFVQTTPGSNDNYGAINLYNSDHGGIQFRKTFVDVNARLGINTTAPAYQLTVSGDDSTPGDFTGAFSVQSQTDNNQRLHMGYATAGNYSWLESVHVGTNITSLILQPRGGNVGIGSTTVPAYKLDVNTPGAGPPQFAVHDQFVGGFRTQWNFSGGQGETDFWNYRGGGTGGFWFKNLNTSDADVGWAKITCGDILSNGTITGTISSTSISTTGNLVVENSANDTRIVMTAGNGVYGSIEVANFANTVKRDLFLNGYGGKVGVNTTSIGASATFHTLGRIRSQDISGDVGCLELQTGSSIVYIFNTNPNINVDMYDNSVWDFKQLRTDSYNNVANFYALNNTFRTYINIGKSTANNQGGYIYYDQGGYFGMGHHYTGWGFGISNNGTFDTSGSITCRSSVSGAGNIRFWDLNHAIHGRYDINGSNLDSMNYYAYGDHIWWNNGLLASQTMKMRLNSAGNVTIGGVVSPGDRLHLYRNAVNSNIGMIIQDDTYQWRIGKRGDTSNIFAIQDDTAAAIRFCIDSAGEVGIGTTQPGYKLTVSGDDSAPGDFTGSFCIQAQSNSNQRLHMGYATSGDYAWIESVKIGTNLQPLLLNARGGNVGVGTTSTAATLHVKSNGQTFMIEGSDHVYQAYSVAGTRKAYVGFPGAGNVDLHMVNENTGNIVLATAGSGGRINCNQKLYAPELSTNLSQWFQYSEHYDQPFLGVFDSNTYVMTEATASGAFSAFAYNIQNMQYVKVGRQANLNIDLAATFTLNFPVPTANMRIAVVLPGGVYRSAYMFNTAYAGWPSNVTGLANPFMLHITNCNNNVGAPIAAAVVLDPGGLRSYAGNYFAGTSYYIRISCSAAITI